jgi:hypothetical protein
VDAQPPGEARKIGLRVEFSSNVSLGEGPFVVDAWPPFTTQGISGWK